MDDAKTIAREADNFADGAIFDPDVARKLAQLARAAPGVSEWALMQAVLRHWDTAATDDKVAMIAAAAIVDVEALDLSEPTRSLSGIADPGTTDPDPVQSRGSLEFWPALAEAWGVPRADAGDSDYVIGAEGKWIATITPNPAFDRFSRMRIARLMALSAELWQLLREAIDVGPHGLGVGDRHGRAIRLLSQAGDFVPRAVDQSDATDPADAARRAVNEETLYRLPTTVAGTPETEVPNG